MREREFFGVDTRPPNPPSQGGHSFLNTAPTGLLLFLGNLYPGLTPGATDGSLLWSYGIVGMIIPTPHGGAALNLTPVLSY